MIKKGFTLAETLIVLVIIGVITSITIPVITANSKQEEYKAKLKKGIATITGAVRKNQANNHENFYSITTAAVKDSPEKEIEHSLYGIFKNNANINIVKTGPATYLDAPDYYAIYFEDGSIMMYKPSDTINDYKHVQIGENVTVGIPIFFDTNGEKGPNILSNCRGYKNLTVKNEYNYPPNGDCSQKSKRIIKDIHKLRLQENHVVTNETSTKWLLYEK